MMKFLVYLILLFKLKVLLGVSLNVGNRDSTGFLISDMLQNSLENITPQPGDILSNVDIVNQLNDYEESRRQEFINLLHLKLAYLKMLATDKIINEKRQLNGADSQIFADSQNNKGTFFRRPCPSYLISCYFYG